MNEPIIDLIKKQDCDIACHNFLDACNNPECHIPKKHTHHEYEDQTIEFFKDNKAVMHCTKCHDEKYEDDLI